MQKTSGGMNECSFIVLPTLLTSAEDVESANPTPSRAALAEEGMLRQLSPVAVRRSAGGVLHQQQVHVHVSADCDSPPALAGRASVTEPAGGVRPMEAGSYSPPSAPPLMCWPPPACQMQAYAMPAGAELAAVVAAVLSSPPACCDTAASAPPAATLEGDEAFGAASAPPAAMLEGDEAFGADGDGDAEALTSVTVPSQIVLAVGGDTNSSRHGESV